METQSNLLSLVTRLPMYIQNKWQDQAFQLKIREDYCPTQLDAVNFASRVAAGVADPAYGLASMKTRRSKKIPLKVGYATQKGSVPNL